MSMECPYCGCELRLAEDVTAAFAATSAQTTCASPRCARELWAELPSGADAAEVEVRLLRAPPPAATVRLPLGKRALAEAMATVVIAIGTVVSALIVGLRYVSWPDPGPVRTEAELMGLAAIGAVVLAAGLILDGTLRMRGGEAPAPRISLVLLALPKTYRA